MEYIGHIYQDKDIDLCVFIENMKKITEASSLLVSYETKDKQGIDTTPHNHFYMEINEDGPTQETIRARIKTYYGLKRKGQLSLTTLRKTKKEAMCYVIKQGDYRGFNISDEDLKEATAYQEECYTKQTYKEFLKAIEDKYINEGMTLTQLIIMFLMANVKYDKPTFEPKIRGRVITLWLKNQGKYEIMAENIKNSLPFYILGNE